MKTDLNIYPVPPPPPLPAAGGKFTDPTFGAEIMRVTDAATDPSGAGTAYSYWYTLNRNSTRVLVQSSPCYWRDFDPVNFQLGAKHSLPAPPGIGYTTFEDALWANTADDLLYVHRGTALYVLNVATNTYTLLFDLAAGLPTGGYFFQASLSADDDVFAATTRNADDTVRGFIGYRRSTKTLLQRQVTTDVNEVQIDKSGRYLFWNTNQQGAGKIEIKIIDLQTNLTTDLTDDAPDFAPSHYDTGTGVVLGAENWRPSVTVRSLATPHTFTTALDYKGWAAGTGIGSGNHFSLRADNEQWALVEHYGAATTTGVLDNELFQVSTDGQQSARRLAHHHSDYHEYYDTPRANISHDGRFIAFTSNWGNSGRRDLFIARIEPPTGTTPAPTPPPTPAPTPPPAPTLLTVKWPTTKTGINNLLAAQRAAGYTLNRLLTTTSAEFTK